MEAEVRKYQLSPDSNIGDCDAIAEVIRFFCAPVFDPKAKIEVDEKYILALLDFAYEMDDSVPLLDFLGIISEACRSGVTEKLEEFISNPSTSKSASMDILTAFGDLFEEDD